MRALWLLPGLLVAGCASTPCGPGTTEVSGVCTFTPAVRCGEGTRLINGKCVPEAGSVTCGFGTIDEDNVCQVAVALLPLTAGRASGLGELTLPAGPAGFGTAIQGAILDGTSLIGLTIHTAGTEGAGKQVIYGGGATATGINGVSRFTAEHVFAMEARQGDSGLEAGPGIIKLDVAGAPEPLVLTDASLVDVVVDDAAHAAVALATVTGTISYQQAQTVVSPTLGPLGDYLRQNGYDGSDTDGDAQDDTWPFSATFNFSSEVIL